MNFTKIVSLIAIFVSAVCAADAKETDTKPVLDGTDAITDGSEMTAEVLDEVLDEQNKPTNAVVSKGYFCWFNEMSTLYKTLTIVGVIGGVAVVGGGIYFATKTPPASSDL